jgi:hypothetical protein
MGLFGWDIARAFLTEAASPVSPPDLVYSASNGNHEVDSPFQHWHFFIFNSFDDKISLND